jgi:7-cyano-7-deazaguanine synthase
MNQKNVAVLASGGLDSAILIHLLSKQFKSVWPVYVRNGHQWESAEIFWLKRFLKKKKVTVTSKGDSHLLKPLVILDLPTRDLYGNHWSITGEKVPGLKSNDQTVYLPGKNLLLISKAAVFCTLNKIENLALGPLKSNPFPDARPEFFKTMEKTVQKSLQFKLKIHTPFLKCSKTQVLSLGHDLPLYLTFSCLAPKKMAHCGRCNKCAERKKAFRLAKMIDLTRYAH